METKICKNCTHRKVYNSGEYKGVVYCSRIDGDDLEYSHNNDNMAGIRFDTLDDTGLIELVLRVSDNFGCVLFEGA